jgi:hypothetical protein
MSGAQRLRGQERVHRTGEGRSAERGRTDGATAVTDMTQQARHPFGLALEARDLASALEAMAPEVVLYPPVTAVPFRGRDEVAPILRMLLEEELCDVECLDEVRTGDALALRFRIGIGGRQFEVVDFLRVDAQDRVYEYRVFARPVADALAYLSVMGPRIALRRGRVRAFLFKYLSRPLPGLLATADKIGTRFGR